MTFIFWFPRFKTIIQYLTILYLMQHNRDTPIQIMLHIVSPYNYVIVAMFPLEVIMGCTTYT